MRALLSLTVVPVLVVCLQACSEDAATTAAPAAAQKTEASDCRTLLPDAVVTGLGWTATDDPTLDSATCSLSTPEGDLSVQRRPVGASSTDEVSAAAKKAFTERCTELDQGAAAPMVDWLGADHPACAVTAEDGAGVNVLLALARDDLLVELRVDPNAATSPDTVQQGLVALEQAAAAHL